MALKLQIKQVRSAIGRPKKQLATLKGLGLGGLQRSVILQDTPEIRGMIRKVQHLVEIKPAD